ncbi:MAG: hypothetical protein ACRDHV_08120 [Actinomycetota bacterium]
MATMHGTLVEGDGPQLVVETSHPRTAYWGDPLGIAAEYLWRKADGWSWLPELDEDSLRILGRVRSEQRNVSIDDEPFPFRVVVDGSEWVARATYREFIVTIHGRHFDLEDVRVVTITDRSAYRDFPM